MLLLVELTLAAACIWSRLCIASPLASAEELQTRDHQLHHRQDSTFIAPVEGDLAQSCTTLKKKTTGGAWNLYYAGAGLLRSPSDSMVIAQVPLSVSDGLDPEDICAVANDINRSCSLSASSFGIKQISIIWTELDPAVAAPGDSPWTCRLHADNNADPAAFDSAEAWADHVWAWTQN